MQSKQPHIQELDELIAGGIESADAACTFLGQDDWLRDCFPLPSVEERDRWLEMWSDDRLAWETILETVLGRNLQSLAEGDGNTVLRTSLRRIRGFFGAQDQSASDSFYRCLEVRFILRVFLPCLATAHRRPSTLLRNVVETGAGEDLEAILQIDPTVLQHVELHSWLYPPESQLRRRRWELLQAALANPVDGFDRRQVKYGIAALLRRIAKRCNQQLTLSTLLKMYHSAASTAGSSHRDKDFADDPATFQKGVRRFSMRLPHFC